MNCNSSETYSLDIICEKDPLVVAYSEFSLQKQKIFFICLSFQQLIFATEVEHLLDGGVFRTLSNMLNI